MKLNTKQVAEKLGIHVSSVNRFHDNKLLTDVATRKEGASKHYSYYESSQVNDYLKENGKGKGLRTKRNNDTEVIKGPQIFQRIEKKLELIEEKINNLLKMWS